MQRPRGRGGSTVWGGTCHLVTVLPGEGTYFTLCAGQIRGVTFHLTFGRKGRCSVLQVGERRPPAREDGASQVSVALGPPGGPLRGPGPGAVGLVGVIGYRGAQRKRGLSCDLGPHLGCEPLHGRGGHREGPAGTPGLHGL